jgi:hypothetical protein
MMSLSKRYLKSKPLCKVTFKLPKEAAPVSGSVFLVGDFNATLDLPTGSSFQFRYLRDDGSWENDWQADSYVPNPFGDGENSVVQL